MDCWIECKDNPFMSHTARLTKLHHANTKSKEKFASHFPHAVAKLHKLGLDLKDLRRHSSKVLSAAAIASGVFASAPLIKEMTVPTHQHMELSTEQKTEQLKMGLKALLPSVAGPLPKETEHQISTLLKSTIGVNAVASLDGNHLNSSYGYIGGEQHMPRFPGDTLGNHDALQVKGITAHRGAFGYFAQSPSQLSQEAIDQEKYYVAVQTLYLPNWNTEHKTLKEWYKFRKVLVVNPTTGKSVVAVIGDAGPAAWTKKHFGGSPEIMDYLRPWEQQNKGKVLLFFIDDSHQHLALGPVEGPVTQFIAQK